MPTYALRVHSCEEVVWSRRKAPNLYVVIYQDGRAVHRTNAVKRNRAPTWDDICNLTSDSPVTMRLWHDCLLRCRDICLGAVDTEISALLNPASPDADYVRLRLTSEDRGSGQHTGTVLVCFMSDAAAIAIEQAQHDIGQLVHVAALMEAAGMVDSSQPAVKTFEAGLGIIITKLDMIIQIGTEVAKIHPYAHMAWTVLTSVYQAVKAEQATQEKLKKLVDTMVSVYSFTEETDPLPQKIKSLEDKVLAIVKQTVECALFIREYSGHGFTTRAIRTTWDNADKTIDDLSDTLVKLKASLESSLTVEGIFLSMQGISLSTQILQKVNNLVQSDALKTLNAAEMNAASRLPCLQGTRVHLLDEITEWLTVSNAAGSILWLSGVAGSGKSTITTSISLSFRGLHRLGAFLFFDRNNPSQSHPNGVIRTLAYLLSRTNPHIASAISAVIQADPEIINSPLQTQFETLLLKLLSSVVNLIQGPILIILDALDECGDPALRRSLLSVISTEFPKLPPSFRFLITSRREADISKSFASRFVEKFVGTATSTEDVQRFISHELDRIQRDNKLATAWPNATQKQTIIDLAGGLFIWAATAIKYIDGYRPNDRIETLIANNSTSLDDLYSFTLRSSAPWDDKIFAKDACAVLACIVFGKLPMTNTTIDALLGAGCFSADVLKYLGCVVQWRPGCVARILHASFADYLTDNSRSKGEPWSITLRTAHQTLSLGCLRILNTQLRFNICNLEDSCILNTDVPDISNQVVTHISPQLSYSTCFWGHHIANCPSDEMILEQIDNFVYTHFLFWVEVLSLLGEVAVASRSLDAAANYVKGHNDHLEDLVSDATKFVSAFAPVIAQAAPHIYLSAVAFTPNQSKTARLFSKWFPNTLGFDSQLGVEWPAIQKVLQGHKSVIISVTFSPDGTLLASGSVDKTACIWDTQTGQLTCPPLHHDDGVSCVRFSPDSRWITTGSGDATIRIWDAQTGDLASKFFTGHPGGIDCVQFSPDGLQIICGSYENTVCVWDVWDAQTGALVAGPFNFRGHTQSIYSIQFSSDGTQIVSGSWCNTIQVWDAQTGDLIAGPFTVHKHPVLSFDFSPDGTQIASASGDETIQVWDAQTGALVAGSFQGHTGVVHSICFSRDGTRIASGSWDKSVCIWDAQTGTLIAGPLTGHTSFVTSVQFSPNGRQLASGSGDNTVRVWDTRPGALDSNSKVHLWDAQRQGVGMSSSPIVVSVTFSPDETKLALLYEDGEVNIWNAHTRQLKCVSKHNGALEVDVVLCVNFSPDSMGIAAGHEDSKICIWKAQTGALVVGPFNGHTDSVLVVQFSSDGTQIASGAKDGTVRVWDAHTGALVTGPLIGHGSYVWSVNFSRDGMKIASGGETAVNIWDTQTGALVAGPLRGHSDRVVAVNFSPDGTHIVSGSQDHTIQVWNAQTGVLVAGPLTGHTAAINSIQFSPDGMQMASGSNDKTVRIWDAQSGLLAAGPFTGHTDCVQSVRFSSDGTELISYSSDLTIRVSKVKRLGQLDPSKNNSLLIFDSGSGWIKNVAGGLMFWVPPWLREGLYLPHNPLVIRAKGTTKLDLTRFVHGTEWTKCFDPKVMDTK